MTPTNTPREHERIRRRQRVLRPPTDTAHDGWEPIRPRSAHGFILPWKVATKGKAKEPQPE